MRMKIPNAVVIGKNEYWIRWTSVLPKMRSGEIRYAEKEIWILRGMERAEAHQVFWHEVVHGILRDMRRHDLNNEAFVKAFCRRLYKVLEEV
jgi:hypothetical protein